jgi:ubiquinone/menaquinone biosynthesis C-methylase UbiE
MSQKDIWEKEYRNPILVTKHDKPQADALRFFKFVRKNLGSWESLKVIDLGSGTGRNANYLAEQGSEVVGIEISETATKLARVRSSESNMAPQYFIQSMGQSWPLRDSSIDVALDVISSNSLTEAERIVYLSELKRVLKPGGLVFIKALTKDGDKNTQNLLQKFSGLEYDTYTMPSLGLTERVFSESDFRELYSDFDVLKLEKKSSKVPFNGQVYNRRFIVAYLSKKA